MNYKVNIVMATYNRLHYTKECLPSLIETASNNIPYMISVIDNGSTDGTPEYLQELFNEKKITNLILNPINLGVSKAHNLLWSMFADRVDIYGKVDNDILFKNKNWLNDIVNILDNCPSVGMAGCSVEWEWEGQNRVPKKFTLMNENGVDYRYKNDNLGGACVFVPKRTNDKFGYWNEGYALYGEEDTDYGFRIRISGMKNVYAMDIENAYHLDEYKDDEYTRFKNEERSKNIKTGGNFWQTLSKYHNDVNSRKTTTNILNEIQYTLQSNIQED
jgi:GT2 family glycosyltransferase